MLKSVALSALARVVRNQTKPARSSSVPNRAKGGRRSAKSPTAIGAATVSTRATASSHTYSEEEPDAVKTPVTAHITTVAVHNATRPARDTKCGILTVVGETCGAGIPTRLAPPAQARRGR